MAVLVQGPIAINSSVGAPVNITAKAFARGVAIAEDGSGSAAGLTVTWPNGTVAEYPPSQQPIVIGNITGGGVGPLVGVPANYSAVNSPATKYCSIVSMGAATAVRVTEYS